MGHPRRKFIKQSALIAAACAAVLQRRARVVAKMLEPQTRLSRGTMIIYYYVGWPARGATPPAGLPFLRAITQVPQRSLFCAALAADDFFAN